jgi:hypothetical protein
MAATSMTQAALQAGENVQLVANTGGVLSLKTQLDLWIPALKLGLNPELATHRTILNWIPVGRQLSAELAALLTNSFYILTPSDPMRAQGAAAMVTLFVYQSCEAVSEAQSAGRITLAQANAIRSQYNVIWP